MAIIVPAILEDTPEAFASRAAEIFKIPEAHRIQVDIADGKFSPRQTIQLNQLDLLNPAYFWEAHLMVENPKEYFLDAKIAGFSSAIFHFEAVADKNELPALVAEIKKLKLQAGLGIGLDTKPEEIFSCLSLFDQILLLEVRPGYSGQKISAGVFESIEKLKKHQKNVKIEVDGGVNIENARKLAQAGAELLIANSALFVPGPEDLTPTRNFEKLTAEIQNF